MALSFDDIKKSPHKHTKPVAANAALVASTLTDDVLDMTALRDNLTSLARARVTLDPAYKHLAPDSKDFTKMVKSWQDQYNLAVRDSLGLTSSTTVGQGLMSIAHSMTTPATHDLTCSNPNQVNMNNLHNTLAGSGITCKKLPTKIAER